MIEPRAPRRPTFQSRRSTARDGGETSNSHGTTFANTINVFQDRCGDLDPLLGAILLGVCEDVTTLFRVWTDKSWKKGVGISELQPSQSRNEICT